MNTQHSMRSGAESLVFTGILFAVGAVAATVIDLTVGLKRFALFLAVG